MANEIAPKYKAWDVLAHTAYTIMYFEVVRVSESWYTLKNLTTLEIRHVSIKLVDGNPLYTLDIAKTVKKEVGDWLNE